ncbi:MAG: hypothetical protein OEY61_10895 [Gammaproteobacteria bacterium]|nr:hypothetical protein [Gammaproteobacteria bacterium]
MNIFTPIRPIIGKLFILAGLCLANNAYAVYPCIDIIKEVSADGGMTWHDANTEVEAVTIINDALYKFTVKRCDYDGLVNVLVTDDILGMTQDLADFPYSNNGKWDSELEQWSVDLNSEAQSFTVPAPGICQTYTGTIQNTATVSASGEIRLESVSDSDDAWIRCEPTKSGGEGCTPGYWKQPHHFDSWPTGITPDTSYSSIFGRTITIRTRDAGLVIDPTLLQALSALGGQVNTAARHSTAAYLNSMSNGVSYDLSADQIIDNLQQSVDGNDFGTLIEALVNFNEQGCPLN